uniref:H-2 class I histocompatibility antigen, alpha chain-like n=1 Tax=Sinocyclocheilus rhinocerous TaxID=307959 RepID=A0A673MX17_9TELE
MAYLVLSDKHQGELNNLNGCLKTCKYCLSSVTSRSILKDQISSGIRPNGDGSFQMSARVEIDRNHKGSYDCLVNHSSLTEPVLAKWGKACLKLDTNLSLHVFYTVCSSEKHYLHFKFTALSQANTLPEFSAEAVADGRQIVYYNNKEKSWVRESLTEDDSEAPVNPPDSRGWFIYQLNTLVYCHECCSVIVELHVLQKITGCELEKLPDGPVNLTVFDEYGFDGEDFIAFNSDALQWIDKNPKAKETKMKWDQQTERNELLQHYLQTSVTLCEHEISSGGSPPEVHVFARKAPDDHSKLVLICLATGFYPRDIEMNIRLDRNIIKDQTSSGIRPNADGTFQLRSSVEIDRNHEGSYDCFVIHSSLTEPASVEWGKYHQKFIFVKNGFYMVLLCE